MFEHAFNRKRTLEHANNQETNFLILGNLNTMGLKYPKQIKSDKIAGTLEEIDFIDYECQRKGRKNIIPKMRRLKKPAGTQYRKTFGISDLDHIIASEHL